MEGDLSTKSSGTTTPRDVSLVRGGLLYRFLVSIRLMDDKHWNVGRRILFVLAIVWVPVVVIRLLHAPDRVMQLLLDYRLEARAIAAVILIVAEPIMDSRFRFLIEHIREAHLLIGPDLAKMDNILDRLRRLRDSFFPELVFALAVAFRAVTAYCLRCGTDERRPVVPNFDWCSLDGRRLVRVTGERPFHTISCARGPLEVAAMDDLRLPSVTAESETCPQPS